MFRMEPKKRKILGIVLIVIGAPIFWYGMYLHREVRHPLWWLVFSLGCALIAPASLLLEWEKIQKKSKKKSKKK